VEGGEKGRGEERRGREGKGGGPGLHQPPPKLISPYALGLGSAALTDSQLVNFSSVSSTSYRRPYLHAASVEIRVSRNNTSLTSWPTVRVSVFYQQSRCC
jgi:hypothetical protein